jgi:hypothetical protein
MTQFAEERFTVLRKFNEALLEGLKAAVFVLENFDDFPAEKRESLTENLRGLIAQNQVMEVMYGDEPGEH